MREGERDLKCGEGDWRIEVNVHTPPNQYVDSYKTGATLALCYDGLHAWFVQL